MPNPNRAANVHLDTLSKIASAKTLHGGDEDPEAWRLIPISFRPFPGFWSMNPSIHRGSDGVYRCVFRNVDYHAPMGVVAANASGKTRTRSVLGVLDPESFALRGCVEMRELDGLTRYPCSALGFEDLRLFETAADGLLCVATAMQTSETGKHEAVLLRLGMAAPPPPQRGAGARVDVHEEAESEPYQIIQAIPMRGPWSGYNQKNWTPFDGTETARFLPVVSVGQIYDASTGILSALPQGAGTSTATCPTCGQSVTGDSAETQAVALEAAPVVPSFPALALGPAPLGFGSPVGLPGPSIGSSSPSLAGHALSPSSAAPVTPQTTPQTRHVHSDGSGTVLIAKRPRALASAPAERTAERTDRGERHHARTIKRSTEAATTPAGWRPNDLRGGTQLVRIADDVWLGLAHRMCWRGVYKHYWHQWYVVDGTGAQIGTSQPFKLSPTDGIEFAAGLVVDPPDAAGERRVIVSYGTCDEQSWLAVTRLSAVLSVIAGRPVAPRVYPTDPTQAQDPVQPEGAEHAFDGDEGGVPQ